jgi:hypothetical protein
MIPTVVKAAFFQTHDLFPVEQGLVQFLKKYPGWQVTSISHQHLNNGVSILMVMQNLDASESEMRAISDEKLM